MGTYSINSLITYYTHSINGARTASGTVLEVNGSSLLVEVDGCARVVLTWDVVR